MSDWDFLHEMSDRGYGPEAIADAAACGYAPWEAEFLDEEWIDSQFDEELDACENDYDSDETVESFASRSGFPLRMLEQHEIFHALVGCAVRHFKNTGRYLQIWGELGEIYAEIKFGLCRHGPRTAGSDGTIAGKLVEVKTISPEKASNRVLVKSQGDFEQLLIIRIGRDFRFQGKLFDRSELKGSNGKFLMGQFSDGKEGGAESHPE